MMCSVESLAVAGAYVVMIAFNALANTDIFGGKDQGEISNQNPTYLTPDGLTFAVWGLIYLLEALLVIYQLNKLPEETEALLQSKFLGLSVRWRLVIAFLLNASWLPVFNNELFWVALVIIVAYLVALIAVYRDLRPSNVSSWTDFLLLTAGISCNMSWVFVASCLNLFFCLGELGWENEYGVAGTPLAAIVVCVIVAQIAVYLVVQGKDIFYGFVAGWALQGIYRMQTFEDASQFPPEARDAGLAGAAGALSAFVWVTTVIGIVILSKNVRDSLCGGRKAEETPKSPTTSPEATVAAAVTEAAAVPEAAEAQPPAAEAAATAAAPAPIIEAV